MNFIKAIGNALVKLGQALGGGPVNPIIIARIEDTTFATLERRFQIVGGSSMDPIASGYQLGAQAVLSAIRQGLVVKSQH